MIKEGVIIRFDNREVIKKTSSKFGNGAHVLISKEHIGKNVKIIIGKSEIIGKKIKIDFLEGVILNRKANRFGTGCHVIIPKEYTEKEVKIII
jgi:putative transposon-encoded protein